MKPRIGYFWIAMMLVACIAVTPWMSAQTVMVNLLETHFTVTDRNGAFVPDLRKEDFAIYDNNKRIDVAELEQSRNAPVSVALVLDRSASVADRFRFVVDSATSFVKSVVRESDDQAMVVAFDSKVYLLQDWSANSNTLVDRLLNLTSAGGTSVFDAIYKTCRDKFDPADARRKIIVLITDGDDTTSRSTYDQAMQMAQRSGASIYVVGIRDEGSMNSRELQGRRVLSNFADLTGGRVFYPDSAQPRQLTALFQKLQVELRNEYRIVYYRDASKDGSFHSVRIETKEKGLNIHAPSGYFTARPVKAF